MFTSLTGSRDGKGLLDHLFYNNLGEIISVLKRLTLMVGVDCTCTFFRDFQKIKNDFFSVRFKLNNGLLPWTDKT